MEVAMKKFETVRGRVIPLNRADVDTDQIISKEFLKRIERTGFGSFAFDEWRKDPEFVLNRPVYQGAPIMVTGPNFGCGS
ncbi:MAG: 3-isopropylmalate dehydratase small subunit, partial [Chloroflexota bacterium]